MRAAEHPSFSQGYWKGSPHPHSLLQLAISAATRPGFILRVKPQNPMTSLLWLLHDGLVGLHLLCPPGSNICLWGKVTPSPGAWGGLLPGWGWTSFSLARAGGSSGGNLCGSHLPPWATSATGQKRALGFQHCSEDFCQDPEQSQPLSSKLACIYCHLFWFIFPKIKMG